MSRSNLRRLLRKEYAVTYVPRVAGIPFRTVRPRTTAQGQQESEGRRPPAQPRATYLHIYGDDVLNNV